MRVAATPADFQSKLARLRTKVSSWERKRMRNNDLPDYTVPTVFARVSQVLFAGDAAEQKQRLLDDGKTVEELVTWVVSVVETEYGLPDVKEALKLVTELVELGVKVFDTTGDPFFEVPPVGQERFLDDVFKPLTTATPNIPTAYCVLPAVYDDTAIVQDGLFYWEDPEPFLECALKLVDGEQWEAALSELDKYFEKMGTADQALAKDAERYVQAGGLVAQSLAALQRFPEAASRLQDLLEGVHRRVLGHTSRVAGKKEDLVKAQRATSVVKAEAQKALEAESIALTAIKTHQRALRLALVEVHSANARFLDEREHFKDAAQSWSAAADVLRAVGERAGELGRTLYCLASDYSRLGDWEAAAKEWEWLASHGKLLASISFSDVMQRGAEARLALQDTDKAAALLERWLPKFRADPAMTPMAQAVEMMLLYVGIHVSDVHRSLDEAATLLDQTKTHILVQVTDERVHHELEEKVEIADASISAARVEREEKRAERERARRDALQEERIKRTPQRYFSFELSADLKRILEVEMDGDDEAALEMFEPLCKNPDSKQLSVLLQTFDAFYRRGCCALRLKRFAHSIRCFEEAFCVLASVETQPLGQPRKDYSSLTWDKVAEPLCGLAFAALIELVHVCLEWQASTYQYRLPLKDCAAHLEKAANGGKYLPLCFKLIGFVDLFVDAAKLMRSAVADKRLRASFPLTDDIPDLFPANRSVQSLLMPCCPLDGFPYSPHRCLLYDLGSRLTRLEWAMHKLTASHEFKVFDDWMRDLVSFEANLAKVKDDYTAEMQSVTKMIDCGQDGEGKPLDAGTLKDCKALLRRAKKEQLKVSFKQFEGRAVALAAHMNRVRAKRVELDTRVQKKKQPNAESSLTKTKLQQRVASKQGAADASAGMDASTEAASSSAQSVESEASKVARRKMLVEGLGSKEADAIMAAENVQRRKDTAKKSASDKGRPSKVKASKKGAKKGKSKGTTTTTNSKDAKAADASRGVVKNEEDDSPSSGSGEEEEAEEAVVDALSASVSKSEQPSALSTKVCSGCQQRLGKGAFNRKNWRASEGALCRSCAPTSHPVEDDKNTQDAPSDCTEDEKDAHVVDDSVRTLRADESPEPSGVATVEALGGATKLDSEKADTPLAASGEVVVKEPKKAKKKKAKKKAKSHTEDNETIADVSSGELLAGDGSRGIAHDDDIAVRKTCIVCGHSLPESGFNRRNWKAAADVPVKCKECSKLEWAASVEANADSEATDATCDVAHETFASKPSLKPCSICRTSLARSSFGSSMWKKADDARVCKECTERVGTTPSATSEDLVVPLVVESIAFGPQDSPPQAVNLAASSSLSATSSEFVMPCKWRDVKPSQVPPRDHADYFRAYCGGEHAPLSTRFGRGSQFEFLLFVTDSELPSRFCYQDGSSMSLSLFPLWMGRVCAAVLSRKLDASSDAPQEYLIDELQREALIMLREFAQEKRELYGRLFARNRATLLAGAEGDVENWQHLILFASVPSNQPSAEEEEDVFSLHEYLERQDEPRHIRWLHRDEVTDRLKESLQDAVLIVESDADTDTLAVDFFHLVVDDVKHHSVDHGTESPAEPRPKLYRCSECEEELARGAFSVKQIKSGDTRRCKVCTKKDVVKAAAPRDATSAAASAKATVPQRFTCRGCKQQLRADKFLKHSAGTHQASPMYPLLCKACEAKEIEDDIERTASALKDKP